MVSLPLLVVGLYVFVVVVVAVDLAGFVVVEWKNWAVQ